MSIINAKEPPSIDVQAFVCPHCSAYTSQKWHFLYAESFDTIPAIPDDHFLAEKMSDKEMEPKARKVLEDWVEKMGSRSPFKDQRKSWHASYERMHNLYASQCYHCEKFSIWVHKDIIYPMFNAEFVPNDDLTDEIKASYREAASIVRLSPKGAAALLRLCVQLLCVQLGEKGKNIDSDIASLVKKGLNPLVQKALDIVRVVGNEAVHPGEINFNDDEKIAHSLFGLVNQIAEQMISNPKKIEELYGGLPQSKRDAIEKRDAPNP
jgi:Domain of unknown function (DUF4145)